MNYDELVNSNGNAVIQAARTPIGLFRKKQIDGKCVNCVVLRAELLDTVLFVNGLERECEQNRTLKDGCQLHFRMAASEDGPATELEVEQGGFRSFAQLLRDSPAAVARRGFISGVVSDLFRYVAHLNSIGIYHVCFSPDNVFVRNGDNRVMLLSHGSFYSGLTDPAVLYDGESVGYVAPEVMSGGAADDRSDVYSLGKFLEFLFSVAEMPYEYRKVISRATREAPEERYESVDDMSSSLRRRGTVRRSFSTMAVAVVVALAIVGAYFWLVPDVTPVEYVNPVAGQPQPEDILNKGFDPTTELGTLPSDTALMMTEEQQRQMKEYEEKCEQIFRKLYTKEADRILSKIYNSAYMGSNEKKFMAGTRSTMDELVKAQVELAGQTHLSDARSQRIATEIIDQLTEQKKAALSSYGIQK